MDNLLQHETFYLKRDVHCFSYPLLNNGLIFLFEIHVDINLKMIPLSRTLTFRIGKSDSLLSKYCMKNNCHYFTRFITVTCSIK